MKKAPPEWYQECLCRRDRAETALEFTEYFLSAPRNEQDSVVHSWDPHLTWKWPNPLRLSCISEQPGNCEERITADLLFQALEYVAAIDQRDAIVGLAVNYNSSLIAGIDADQIFQRIAFAVGGEAKDALLAFLRRDPRDRTMEAFLLTAKKDPAGGYELSFDWGIK